MGFKPTEEEIIEYTANLRKPTGEKGLEVASFMNDGNKPMNLHTLSVLNAQPYDSILEVGMGNGAFIKCILSDQTISYTGLDYSETMIQESEKINQDFINNGQAEFILGDVASIPFKEASFDKVFTVNTLYFWEDLNNTLNELKRVLKPNGQLLLSIRPKENMLQFPVTKYDFNLVETDDILASLEQNGFSDIELTHIKEPAIEKWGQVLKRETLIIKSTCEK